jgi:hypothetical protein
MIRRARMQGHPDAVAARRGPRLDRRPVRPRRHPRRRGREPPVARPRALPRADVALHRRDALGHRSPAAARGRFGDWGRLRFTMDEGSPGRPRRVQAAVRRRPGLPGEALINWCPGCRTSVSDLEVVATPRRARCGRSATTSSTTTVASRTRRTITVATTRPRRSWATPRWPCTPTTSATARLSAGGCDPVRRPDVPVIADDVVRRTSAPARSRSPRPTTTTTLPPASATGCRWSTSWTTTAGATSVAAVRRA